MQKVPTHFTVKKQRIQAYFHQPNVTTNQRLPIIVMANGYGMEWQFGTDKFINAFTQSGIATLNFDYRHFGESEGQPRQLVDIPGQQEDLLTAIEHAKAQPWVDPSRIIVWGSSLGGGHAISVVAQSPSICAMVAQVPHCCSRAAFKTVTLTNLWKGMSRAIVDAARSLFAAQPLLIPILSEPENYGVMNYPGWLQSYTLLAKNSQTWKNTMPARSLLKGGDYRPIQVAESIQCPSLIVAAVDDAGVSIESVKETAQRITQCELKMIEGDHFGVYYGEPISDVIETELTFIKRHAFD